MIESGIVGRVTSGIVGRLGGGLPLRPKFALDPLDLTDQFGNTPEAAIRASAGTVFDYAGVLQTIPTDMHRLSGGRYSGGAWYRDDGAGNSLHPHRNIDGVLVPWTYPDWTIGAWSAGSYCNDGTYYYYTLAGDIDSAAFGDGITWVNMGLYDRTYGLLCNADEAEFGDAAQEVDPSLPYPGWTDPEGVSRGNKDAAIAITHDMAVLEAAQDLICDALGCNLAELTANKASVDRLLGAKRLGLKVQIQITGGVFSA